MINGSYVKWDYDNTDLAVAGVFINGFEWIFIKILTFALIG